jgi:hypothetical protein
VFENRFGHQRNHCTPVRRDNHRTQHLMIRGDRPVAMDFVQTRRTVNRRGGNIPRTIEGHSIMPSKPQHRFKRFAALELAKDARERRP